MNSLEVSKIARFCTEFVKKFVPNLSSYVRCSWYSASVQAMYSICMIHSVLILKVPMFKRRTAQAFRANVLRGVQLTEHQYSFMNTTVLHVFNFKCLMFQIELPSRG